jgi:hypothetical protein
MTIRVPERLEVIWLYSSDSVLYDWPMMVYARVVAGTPPSSWQCRSVGQ